MEIQEGTAQTPSAPLQAGHARFWQRPSHISHRDSLGLRSPDSAQAGSGLGPRSWRRWGGPRFLPSPPSPAGPSGSQLGPGARRREAGSVGPAAVTKRPRAAGRPASGPRPASLTWAEPAGGTPSPPPPGTLLTASLRGGSRFSPENKTPHRGPGAGNSRQLPSRTPLGPGKLCGSWKRDLVDVGGGGSRQTESAQGLATSQPPGLRTQPASPGCLPLSSRPNALPGAPLYQRGSRAPEPAPPARRTHLPAAAAAGR